MRLHEHPHRDVDHMRDALGRGRGREIEQHRLEGSGEAGFQKLSGHDIAIRGGTVFDGGGKMTCATAKALELADRGALPGSARRRSDLRPIIT